MENVQTIRHYADILAISHKQSKPLVISLEMGNYTGLMHEVVESFLEERPDAFKLLKITGPTAQQIQSELSVLQLPALLIIDQGNIKAIFQGLVARHEILEVLAKIN